jgi:Xaa-Pro aminopeptidase
VAYRDPVVAAKIEQVPGILAELGLDAWMLFVRESAGVHDPSLDLVVGTNVTWHSAFLLTRGGERIAVIGSLDRANMERHGHYPEIVSYVGGIGDDLRKVLARLDPQRMAVNFSEDDPAADGMTHGMYLTLQRLLAETPYGGRLESSVKLIGALRGRKTAVERERIGAACAATVEIFARLTPRLRVGLTEKRVAAMILEEMAKTPGLEPAWDPEHCPAVFTGPGSAGAHAGPTDTAIEPGHLMNVDFGVRKDGFCSDLQRTWYFLRPGEERAPAAVERGVETIIEAIRAGAAALKPGRQGVEIDALVRGAVTGAGYEEYPHGTGHQVGRVAHDGGGGLLPAWERYGQMPFFHLEPGQCYTIEPRLTVEGHGIATVEEIFAVTEAGGEMLSRPQETLYLVR